MNVLLINPPLTDPFQIPLGAPVLAAYLQSRGATVAQRDMSLEFIDHVMRLVARERSWDANRLLRTLQSGGFYNLRLNHLASLWLFEILSFYFRKFNLDIGSPPEMDLSFGRLGVRSEDDLLRLVNDRRKNPFWDFFEKRLLPSVRKRTPGWVGVSVSYEWQMIPALTIASLLPRRNILAKICIGGPYITYARNRLLNHPGLVAAADAYVVFGGETPLFELLRKPHKRHYHRIPGLVYAAGQTVKSTAPAAPVSAACAHAPLFASRALQLCLLPEPVLPVTAAYSACPYGRCAFCSTHHAYLSPDNAKPVEQILAELQALERKHGCTHFTFNDDCIALATVIDLSRRLIAAKKRYRFFAAIRSSEKMTEADLRLMKQAGFLRLQFGFESAADRMLKRFDKGRSHEDMLRLLHMARRAGISVLLSAFIGFPGERPAEAEATLRFFNTQSHLFDAASLVPYSFEEGSRAWNDPNRYGIAPVASSPHDLFHDRTYRIKSGISRETAVRLMDETLIRSNYEPLLGTAASLLYLSKQGYASFMKMILNARRTGSILHPQWRLEEAIS